MKRCYRCGRPGNWTSDYCPECSQAAALEERNRIDKERLEKDAKDREEQRRRDRERDELERKHRAEQLRQEERFREKQLKQDKELREQQLQLEEEREKNHQREIEALERANEIEQKRAEAEQRRYEEEKWEREQEKIAQEWGNRKKYLDGLPDSEMAIFFEESANARERSYLQQRYRGCISSEDYLALIKDEDKYLAKKKISRFINSHSKGETLDYLLNVEPCWFEQIVEKEHLLDGLMELSPELQNECANQATSKDRQKILRIGNTLKMFKSMSFVDRQIYFREFVHSKCAGRTYRPDGYSDEIGVLYFQMEPLYIEALDSEEKAMYLKNRQDAEKEYYLEQERLKKQYQQEQERKKQLEIERQKKVEARQKEIEALRREFNDKWNENEKLVAECNEINKKVMGRIALCESCKKERKKTLSIGCTTPFIILLVVGMTKTQNQVIVLSAGFIIMLLAIGIPIRAFIISRKIKRLERENAEDVANQKPIIEKSKQLVARINELHGMIPKS